MIYFSTRRRRARTIGAVTATFLLCAPAAAAFASGADTATVTFIPDDPTQPTYEGHETYSSADSGNGTRFVTTSTFHIRMRGTDGSFLTLREIAHTTIGPNGATSVFDTPTLSCS